MVQRPNCKAVLLGSFGIGKTSLTIMDNHQALVGPNHQRQMIEFESGKVDLFVWNTAGQERLCVLTPLYAHSAVELIVALNDLDSFNDIPVWTDLFSSSCDKYLSMVLAVNKIDRPAQPCMSHDAIK
jgi:GTPase SAR1 family protein